MTLRSPRRLLSFLALLLALGAPLQAGAKRPMTVENFWAMERVGSPALSPDGRWVAFTVTRHSIEKNQGDSDLWLGPLDGGAPPRRLTWNEGSDGSPVWSPDGGTLAFVSKRGEGEPQLFLLPVDGGEAQPVTKLPVGVQDPKWFPDGKRIAFAAITWPDLDADWKAVQKRLDEQKEDKVKAKISESRLWRFWDQYRTDGRVWHFFAVDLASREVEDLTPGLRRLLGMPSPSGGWDLAPDGKEIVFSANSTEPPYGTLNYDLYTVALGGETPGAPRNVTAGNPAEDAAPRYSPDGRFIVYGRKGRPDTDSDFPRLARYDRTSGEVRDLAAGWDGVPAQWAFTPDGKGLVFHGGSRGRVHLYALPIDGGEPRLVAQGGVTGGVKAVASPSGEIVLVFRRERIQTPAELFSVRLAGGEPRALTSFNAERLAGLDLGTVEEVTFGGAGGEPVHMLLVFPPGFDRGRKWPLVHLIHGGPHAASQDEFEGWNPALFASPGYVVALVNFHGSSGYGQAFADSILGNQADLPFADLMQATAHLIAQGYVDAERMAAGGGSYGGYMAAWILGHTHRFAALFSHAGVYDLMAQFASDVTWTRPASYGGAPWIDPAKVDRYSPSRYAASFATPMLILHGEKDYRVPYTQGVNLYGVLQGKGVPARIVIFPDEGHGGLKPRSSVLWHEEVFNWLDRHFGRP
jgi:dipeptidyl aminopeptidase/acylaminoacyl peptidase